MLSVTCEFKFCAAHRLIHHPGKCRWLHGHNYHVEAVVSRVTVGQLGQSGMVVDFADVKREIGGWIDQNWDHNTILNSNDPLLWVNGDPLNPGTPETEQVITKRFGRMPYLFAGLEPTAERMALVLMERPWKLTRNDLPDWCDEVRLTSVRVWETDGCSALITEG